MTTGKQFILVTAIATTFGPVFAESSSQPTNTGEYAESIRPFHVNFPEAALEQNFGQYEGKKIRLPEKVAEPSQDFLSFHRSEIFAA